MFSWICPRCGRDVPPSKTDCPHCEEELKAIAAANPAPEQQPGAQGLPQPGFPQPGFAQPGFPQPPYAQAGPPPVSSPPAPPPSQPRYESQGNGQGFAPPYASGASGPPAQQQGFTYGQQQAYGQPPQYAPNAAYGQHGAWGAPAQKKPMPTWLLSLIFAAAILAIGSGIYLGMQRFGKTNPQEKAGLENPANPSKAKVTNQLQKYVEVVGIRLMTDKKKPAARFLVVNHSSGTIDGLAANVTLWASTSRSEEDSVASFTFHVPRLGPNESKELTEPLKTKLKIYELPDWQNANADIQITSPQKDN